MTWVEKQISEAANAACVVLCGRGEYPGDPMAPVFAQGLFSLAYTETGQDWPKWEGLVHYVRAVMTVWPSRDKTELAMGPWQIRPIYRADAWRCWQQHAERRGLTAYEPHPRDLRGHALEVAWYLWRYDLHHVRYGDPHKTFPTLHHCGGPKGRLIWQDYLETGNLDLAVEMRGKDPERWGRYMDRYQEGLRLWEEEVEGP